MDVLRLIKATTTLSIVLGGSLAIQACGDNFALFDYPLVGESKSSDDNITTASIGGDNETRQAIRNERVDVANPMQWIYNLYQPSNSNTRPFAQRPQMTQVMPVASRKPMAPLPTIDNNDVLRARQTQKFDPFSNQGGFDDVDTTASLGPSRSADDPSLFNWSSQQGKIIKVRTGDTIYNLAQEHNVPVEVLMTTNSIYDPQQLRIGDNLLIPRRVGGEPSVNSSQFRPIQEKYTPYFSRAEKLPNSENLPKVVNTRDLDANIDKQINNIQPTSAARVHQVQSGETLQTIAAKNNVSWTNLAKLNGLEPTARLNEGSRLLMPSPTTTAQLKNYTPVAASDPRSLNTASIGKPMQLVPTEWKSSLTPTIRPVPTKATASTSAILPPVMAPAVLPSNKKGSLVPVDPTRLVTGSIDPKPVSNLSTSEIDERVKKYGFRWPVNGRVIEKFGRRTNGTVNLGINISVPDGTTVHAAENGIVTVAEKSANGMGNVVVIRHDSQWSSTYAHLDAIRVRPGDAISRGDAIAYSGHSGNAISPQLFFALNKQDRSVDPEQYLVTDSRTSRQ